MNCERAEQLISCHLDGALDAETAAAVQLHCDECQSCNAELVELVQLASLMTSLEEDLPDEVSVILSEIADDGKLTSLLQGAAESTPVDLRDRILAATVNQNPVWPVWLSSFRPVRWAAACGCLAVAALLAWTGMGSDNGSVTPNAEVVKKPAVSGVGKVQTVTNPPEATAVMEDKQAEPVRKFRVRKDTGNSQVASAKPMSAARSNKVVIKPVEVDHVAEIVASESEPELPMTLDESNSDAGMDLGGPVKIARNDSEPDIAGSLDAVHKAAAEKAKLRRSRVLASADTTIALGPKPEQITILEARF